MRKNACSQITVHFHFTYTQKKNSAMKIQCIIFIQSQFRGMSHFMRVTIDI
jgi:hypothetical protein